MWANQGTGYRGEQEQRPAPAARARGTAKHSPWRVQLHQRAGLQAIATPLLGILQRLTGEVGSLDRKCGNNSPMIWKNRQNKSVIPHDTQDRFTSGEFVTYTQGNTRRWKDVRWRNNSGLEWLQLLVSPRNLHLLVQLVNLFFVLIQWGGWRWCLVFFLLRLKGRFRVPHHILQKVFCITVENANAMSTSQTLRHKILLNKAAIQRVRVWCSDNQRAW